MTAPSLSEIDEKLLRLADHCSPDEISREIGGVLTPAGVALRIKEMLKSRDWLSAAEQDEIVTQKMRRILSELETRYMDLDSAKVQLSALKMIGERLDKRREATAEEKNQLYQNQAQIMFEAIAALVAKAELDERARLAVREALPEAVYVIQARNAGHEIEA